MRALTRGLVLAALLGALLQPPHRAAVAASEQPANAVTARVGQGSWGVAMCLGCGAAIVGVGGATWGGVLLLSLFHPDVVGACGYICYRAFT